MALASSPGLFFLFKIKEIYMTTLLPRDADNNPIPALRLKSGGAQTISATATTARNATAFHADTRVISVYATGPVYVALGDSDIEATNTDHFIPEGLYYDIAIGGGSQGPHATHLAVLRAD